MIRVSGRKQEKRGGFSLLEVIIAMAVLAFGLLGVGAMQLHALRGGASSQHLSEASMLANERLEVLNRVDWTDAAVTDSGDAWTNPRTVTASGVTFTVDSRVDDATAERKAVDVRVRWQGELGRTQSVVFASARLRES